MTEPWICPRCGIVHAGWVSQCTCPPPLFTAVSAAAYEGYIGGDEPVDDKPKKHHFQFQYKVGSGSSARGGQSHRKASTYTDALIDFFRTTAIHGSEIHSIVFTLEKVDGKEI